MASALPFNDENVSLRRVICPWLNRYGEARKDQLTRHEDRGGIERRDPRCLPVPQATYPTASGSVVSAGFAPFSMYLFSLPRDSSKWVFMAATASSSSPDSIASTTD